MGQHYSSNTVNTLKDIEKNEQEIRSYGSSLHMSYNDKSKCIPYFNELMQCQQWHPNNSSYCNDKMELFLKCSILAGLNYQPATETASDKFSTKLPSELPIRSPMNIY